MQIRGLLLVALATTVGSQSVNPITKVIQLLSELEAKLLADGEAEKKAYAEYFEWCDDASKTTAFAIKTASSEKEGLIATIDKAAADVEMLTATISDLAGSISTDEADLKAATEIRDAERADFEKAEAELVDGVDTLGRAIGIIERNMKGSALVQTKVDITNLNNVMQALSVVIDAASFSGHDKQKLMSLVQNRQGSDEDDSDLGAPAPDAYKTHSTNIVDVLEDMKEKAEGQLSEIRKSEMNSKHNYELLEQSLTDEIKASTNEMGKAKTGKNEAAETKATSEGALAVTVKNLAQLQTTLETCGNDCMEKASDHEVTVNGRAEELKALAAAKKILQDTTGGAQAQTYSFLQVSSNSVSSIKSRADLANIEVINLVKKLAREQHSTQLSQLASRITAVMKYSSGSNDDVFAKVKGLISELIARLTKEAGEEADEKAYCDEEMAKTEQKKDDLSSTVSKLSAKIDKAAANSAQLKQEVKELQSELIALAKQQAEMDTMRKDGHDAFVVAKADLEQGLEGVRQALKVLQDYYATGSEDAALMQQPAAPEKHAKSAGAGGSIIAMIEVAESDIAQNLAQEETEEASAQGDYEKVTQENKITKMMKDQDVKYKTKEAADLDKAVSELSSDREGTQTELDAVLQYYTNLRGRCIAKPETYEQRKARREAEIAGLKEALNILEGEAVFLQKKSGFRGARRH